MPVILIDGTTSSSTDLTVCNYALQMIGENVITQTQLDNQSTKPAKLCATFFPYARDQVLEAQNWNFAQKHRLLDYADDFGIYPDDGTDNDVLDIEGITAAAPPVVTITGHPYNTGNLIFIEDVSGMTEVNNKVFEITKVDADTFSLTDIDGTKYTAWTSGGTAIRREVYDIYQNGYTYDVPSDCIHPIRLDDGTDGPGPEFITIGTSPNQRILTTISDAVLIYTAQITDTDVWPTRFINCMAAALAMKLIIPLKKKGADIKSITGFYQLYLNQGMTVDYREKKALPNSKDPWLTSGGFIQ